MLPLRNSLKVLASRISSEPWLFLNGAQAQDLAPRAVVQPHRGLRQTLSAPDWDGQSLFSQVAILATPSRQETVEYLALAWKASLQGGQIHLCIENDLGADGYRKRFKSLQPEVYSKHHCKCLTFKVGAFPEDLLPAEGDPRRLRPPFPEADFVSCPGLFSWDRPDPGSRCLLAHLPPAMEGLGADFGCGPGLLVRELLAREATSVEAVDVDARALQACRENCQHDSRLTTHWLDLTTERPAQSYDWITLNPPFHGLGREIRGLGLALLARARQCLKPGGRLWMVANQDLPYEAALEGRGQQLFRGGGYKVLSWQQNA